MIGRKAQVGLILVGALALCALGAGNAAAATSGTTAVTCVDTSPTNNGDYTDAHCDTTGTPEKSRYKHEAFPSNPTSEVTGTNEKTKNNTTERTPAILQATIGGLNVEIICQKVSSEGTFTNTLVGEEHRIEGSGIVGEVSECTVPKPAGAGCTVHSPGQPTGSGKSNTLKSESIEGTPMTRKILPASGTELGQLVLEGCSSPINGTCTITGSISTEPSGQMAAGGGKGASSGATLITNVPKNAGSTLIVGGQKGGVTQTETITMKGGNPIGSTGPPF